MGRRKIEIKPIRDDRNRSVTFLKRKGGLFKKAHELSVLCSVDVAVIIFGHNKKLYEYSSSEIQDIIGRFQYYGGAHEHKGPADFADKNGGGSDDEEGEEGGEEGGEQRGTPGPEQQMMGMQNHPGFQHVKHGTPGPSAQSPPMHNGAIPQFQRGLSPMPPGMSRPSSRADQHPGHLRRTSSNLAPQHVQGQVPQQNYAYTPNPPFYNPQAAGQNRPSPYPPPPQQQPGTYPPPNVPPQAPPQHPHVQQMIVQDSRRSSVPVVYAGQQQPIPGQAPQANMQRNPSDTHLQPPQHPQRMGSPQPPSQRATPSPQPPQHHQFQSPPMPQPRPLSAQAKHSIFTPIDDSRSMLAANWGQTSNAEAMRSEPAIKSEGGPRSASIDVAQMQRDRPGARSNVPSPRPPPSRTYHSKSPQPPRIDGRASVPNVPPPTRQNTNQSADAKRPKLNLQIPAESSGDEGTASALDDPNTAQAGNTAGGHHQGPTHGVVLPPPSPSAGALLSAGAQGPPNPFARPPPPMSTNPHAMNRDANHIETPISALPSRFMSDNLLPSPSTFYPEWGFGRSNDSNMLPSPLNFQTPVVGNGQGWREEERKRPTDEDGGGDSKRTKT